MPVSTYPGIDSPLITAMLELLREGHALDVVCKKHRIVRQTFMNWAKADSKLLTAKNEAQASAQVWIYQQLKVEDTNLWSKWMTMLERRDPANYSTSVKLAIKEFEVQLIDAISDLDDTTRDAILERLATIDISR